MKSLFVVFCLTCTFAGLLVADTIVKTENLADSRADFLRSFPAAGVPDANGWNYGWYDYAADADNTYNHDTDFQQYTDGQIRGNGFGTVPSGAPWTGVYANNNGHPQGGATEQWPIRRYTVEAGTPADIALTWSLEAQNTNGTGTTLNVYRNGTQIATATTRQAAGESATLDITGLAVGDIFDFALTPVGVDGNNSQGGDGSYFGGVFSVSHEFNTQGIVADSRAEFSSAQGQDDWTHGYLSDFANNQPQVGESHSGSFNAFTGAHWTGSLWDLGGGSPWTNLSNSDGHPNGAGGEHWATRRWTVPANESGDLLVEFDLAKSNNSGGTTLFIIHNGVVVDSVQTNGALVEEWVKVSSVDAGDTIDIALSPLFNGNAADGSDASQFGAKIHLLVVETDSDADGLPDVWEEIYSPGDLTKLSGLNDADYDNDGVTDLAEYTEGTDPTYNPDTDADGLPDVWEEIYSPGDLTTLSGLNDADADNDNATDLAEYTAGTDPIDTDSDDDGLNDGAEIATHNTNPLKADSDDDGLNDEAEVNTHGTNPLLADSDADGLSDNDELNTWETDPVVSNLIGDSKAEFSGVHGQEGWSNGYLADFTNNQPQLGDVHGGSLTLFPADGTTTRSVDNLWNGTNWDFVTNPPWTFISDIGGHPDNTPADPAIGERWATRRWIAAAADTGDILVSYNLSKPNDGGGTTLFIVHNGKVVSSAQSNNAAGTTDSVRIDNVIPGDTVDLALSPLFNGNTSAGGDSSNFGAKINLLFAREPSDADIDGLPDAWETRYFPNDLTKLSGLGGADFDNDGSSDLDEHAAGTDPTDADTDVDGLNDGAEDVAGTDPLNDDSDDDGLKDGAEVTTHNTDPLDADSDGDGLNDGAEVNTWDTDPNNANSDGDSANDGDEVAAGFDPADPASDPATVITDSRTAFSGVQGENGWEWGYRNLTADGGVQDYDPQADFVAFPDNSWNGSKWDLSGGAPWTELGREATHPNGSNNAANGGGLHWTVRRWTAGNDIGSVKPVALRWNVRATNLGGTGVTGALHINGTRVDSLTINGNDGTGGVRTLYANIVPGDIVDLILSSEGPTGDQHDGSDGSANWLTVDSYIPPNAVQPDGTAFVPAVSEALKITNITVDLANGTMTLTWPTAVGRTYAVDTSTGLSAEGTADGFIEYDDSIPGVADEVSYVIQLGDPVPAFIWARVRDITGNE